MTAQRDGAQPSPRTVPSESRRVLFGPMPPTGVSSAVVRRLRAAIGLGLLADGDRLPKEADLAKQLGITTFSLREALGMLRDEGLIVTRPGKYGGSFITHPPESDALAQDELVRLSSLELRDLGDWRQMLAAHSAALAAQRASESQLTRLESYAHQVAEADTTQKARRAHGRFHVELASAAQSMRMSRAEFAMHEEIDWLFGRVLESHEQRIASSEGLLTIVEAVRSHRPDDARVAAEHYSAKVVDKLARLRLELIAARQNEPGTLPSGAVASTMELEVRSIAASLVDRLKVLAREVTPALAADLEPQDVRTRVSMAVLKQIDGLPPVIDGIGLNAEVGVVKGNPYWIEWWHITEAGPVRDSTHVMDPSREDFYDYASMELIAYPRKNHKEWASGPYVDYGGVDDYTITFAAPILADGRFLGVAAADMRVAELERYLAPWLAAADGVCALLNAENRVIVSNSVAHGVGDIVTATEGDRRADLGMFGWSVISSAETGADNH